MEVVGKSAGSGSDVSLGVGEGKVEGKAAGSALGWSLFNSEKKRLFLEAARIYYPNITKCCEVIGINWRTYYNHVKTDKDFAERLAAIDREVTDRIEGVMAQEAVNPKSFLDRMAYLRAHRPELYDRAKVLKVEGVKAGYSEAQARARLAEVAVDAEIVANYQRRKGRKAKQIGGQAGGETVAGEGVEDSKK